MLIGRVGQGLAFMEQRSESNGRKYRDMKIPKIALSLLILMRVCSVSLDALLLGSGWEEREQMRPLSCGSIYRTVTLAPSDTNNSHHSLVVTVLNVPGTALDVFQI